MAQRTAAARDRDREGASARPARMSLKLERRHRDIAIERGRMLREPRGVMSSFFFCFSKDKDRGNLQRTRGICRTINRDGLCARVNVTRIARRRRSLIDGEMIYFADDLVM